jgi:hypothetical protein
MDINDAREYRRDEYMSSVGFSVQWHALAQWHDSTAVVLTTRESRDQAIMRMRP